LSEVRAEFENGGMRRWKVYR